MSCGERGIGFFIFKFKNLKKSSDEKNFLSIRESVKFFIR